MCRALVLIVLGCLPMMLAAHGRGCSPARVDTIVSGARLQNVNIIEALKEAGRQSGICFGVDIREAGWVERRSSFAQPVSLSGLLAAFDLASSYSIQGNVVAVRAGARGPRDWLDVAVPTFTMARSPLAVASDKLFAFLLSIDHPKEGSVGSIPVSDGSSEVKAIAMKGASLRSILNVMVAGSNHAGMWFTTGAHPRSRSLSRGDPPWRILAYSELAGSR